MTSFWRVPIFARQEGVPASTLYQCLTRSLRRPAAPRIVRVIRKAVATPTRDDSLVIEIGSARIRVAAGFDRAMLASVLDVIEAQA